MDFDNNYSGALFFRKDGTWSGVFEINDTKHFAHLIKSEDITHLVVHPFRKDGKSPMKKVLLKRRIQRTNATSGPIGRIPDPEHPLCVWKRVEIGKTRYFLQIKPDAQAFNIPPSDPF